MAMALAVVAAAVVSCKTPDLTYRMDAHWIYVNSSSRTIEVQIGSGVSSTSDTTVNFTLLPSEKHVIYRHGYAQSKDMTIQDYTSPYAAKGATVFVCGVSKVITSDYFLNRDAYTIENLGYNDFQFTYEFTNAILTQMGF